MNLTKEKKLSNHMEFALKLAVAKAGGTTALASAIGVTPQAISQWAVCTPRRVMDVERESGVSRHDLRPDIFGDE